MKKAQAFDTFKLMIAAVVAVAILGILLAILGGIITPGGEAAPAIRAKLDDAFNFRGSTFVTTSEATFREGTIFSADSFLDTLGGVGYINFYCGALYETSLCNDGSPDGNGLSGTSTLTINGDFSAPVSACCPKTITSTSPCKIGIGVDTLSCATTSP